MMNRRNMLMSSAAVVGVAAAAGAAAYVRAGEKAGDGGTFEITKSEAEWRNILTPNQYAVLREEATERPGTSPLLHEKRAGLFKCAGCALPVYSSEHKFDSGTGWPSFWQAVDESNIGTTEDNKLFMTRTEVHCRRCGGHLGHIFDDGPKPTGKRHCINGVAMTFTPAAQQS